MSLTEKATKVLEKMAHKLDTDPAYRAKVLQEMELSGVHKDSQLICSVVDDNFKPGSVGDLLMYGMDHNYPETLTKKAHSLFYQWHGCGD